MQTELYCPLDGKKLAKAKWENHYNDRWQTLICPDNHLWDIGEPFYKNGLEFAPVKLSKCECGEEMPGRDMKDIDGKKTCPVCFEKIKKAWRMDKEQSYARLEITPIRTTNGVIYQISTSIEIKPYPNPFWYGGCYGGGGAKDEQELQKAIQSFEQEVAKLKENGMEKVEIIKHDEVIHTEQVRLEKPVPEAKSKTKAKPKPVPEIKAEKPKQPVLL